MDGVNRQQNKNSQRYQLGQTAASIARRSAVAGLSGGVGRAMQKAAEGAAHAAVARGAEHTARLYRARRAARLREMRARGENVERRKDAKKLTGPSFWFVAACAVLKDILDLFLSVTVLLSVFIIMTGFLITFLILFYLFFKGVKPDVRKVASFVISTCVEMLPLLSILPATTLNLFIIRSLEHSANKRGQAVIGRMQSFSQRFS